MSLNSVTQSSSNILVSYNSLPIEPLFLCTLNFYYCPENSATTFLESIQTASFLLVIIGIKSSSIYVLRISSPSKTPAVTFASRSLVNCSFRYLKYSSSFNKALAYCFIRPSLMWKDGSSYENVRKWLDEWFA